MISMDMGSFLWTRGVMGYALWVDKDKCRLSCERTESWRIFE